MEMDGKLGKAVRRRKDGRRDDEDEMRVEEDGMREEVDGKKK